MKNTKKIVAIVVLIAMLSSLLQISVFATEAADNFRKALAEGGNVTLTENITVTDETAEAANVISKDTTVNFGDKTFTLDVSGKSANWLGIRINAGNIVFNGTTGGITTANTVENGEGVEELYDVIVGTLENPANLTIKGGRYIAGTSAVSVNKGTVTIEGGYFKSMLEGEATYLLNCIDANYNNGTAKIIVKGGTFLNFDPSNNKAETGGNINYVAEGYKVVSKAVAEGTEYTVVEDEAYNFKKALADGGNVTLTENITVTDESAEAANIISKDTTVNFGDKTFTLDVSGKSANWLGIRINAGNVVFNGTTGGITTANTVENGEGIEELYDVIVGTLENPANLTIKGGRYIAGTSAVSVNKGTVTIEGGYFKSMLEGEATYLLNCIDANYNNGTAKIIVKGGTFLNFDPSNNKAETGGNINYVAEGYKVVSKAVAEGTEYTVVCAHSNCEYHERKEATYSATGTEAYWVCKLCSKWFNDEAKTLENTSKTPVIIPKLVEVSNNNANISQDAVDSAIKDSTTSNSNTVVIPAVDASNNVTSVTVPVSSLEDVAKEEKALTIETAEATVTLDSTAVEKIVEQVGSATDLKIEITKIEDKVLNEKQKAALKDKESAVILSATILANGKTISNFGGGKVKLEIPFVPANNANGNDYRVIYISDEGLVTEIPTQYVDGFIVVELEHFSEYAIVKMAAAQNNSNQPATNNSNAATQNTATNATTSNPKTGDGIVVYFIILAVAVVGICGIVVIKSKRK